MNRNLPHFPSDLKLNEFDEVTSVLFICNYNAVRSPMAEMLVKHYLGTKIFVDSVGLRPETEEANPFTVAVLKEIGLDLSNHVPKSFEALNDGSYDLMITLSPDSHHKAIELTRTMASDVEFWPTFDPTTTQGNREVIMESFRSLRNMLDQKIRSRFNISKTTP
jgi:protein-tyrosine-phosphatase